MQQVSRRRFLLGAGAAASVGLAGCSGTRVGEQGVTQSEQSVGEVGDQPVQEDETASYVDVYEAAIPSVVLVQAFLPTGQSQGSGWVYDDTHVVTNHHVVADAEAVDVQFSNGDWAEATVVGSDRFSDLAVLEVAGKPAAAEPLPLMTGDPPVGRRVVAIGNPYGLEGSMSEGIVSGVNRLLPNINGVQIADTIQTDVAVNPGNSGGPLLRLDGTVVGCINAGGGENLGFAISAAMIRRVVPTLVEHGDYQHAAMGISMTNVTPTVARVNDLDGVSGVMVVTVADSGPAAGLLQPATGTTTVGGVRVPVGGDVLVAIDDTRIASQQAYATYLALRTRPGDVVQATILRDGELVDRTLTLGTRGGGA
ncbi:S1C family serine protease [Haloarchaeobius amylolyticus]|uniref:S1C family serine protease n=1 Tax=Haloarchaeobius amylolyticus TaxID=1198296 RepID=UPI002270FE7F|nr:trypsin-like peptidase domain-containing protein [Haloarchaeobius amylolyticus]